MRRAAARSAYSTALIVVVTAALTFESARTQAHAADPAAPGAPPSAPAAAPRGVHGEWLSENGDGVIAIYTAPDGSLEGKIVRGTGGPPRLDGKNPDPKLRTRPLLGVVILTGMKADGPKRWSGGTIYDPDSGKTYRCILTLAGEDRIDLRGYIGISLIGRTSHWKRVGS